LSQFNYTAFAGSAEPAISFTEKKGLLEMNLHVHFATAPFFRQLTRRNEPGPQQTPVAEPLE